MPTCSNCGTPTNLCHCSNQQIPLTAGSGWKKTRVPLSAEAEYNKLQTLEKQVAELQRQLLVTQDAHREELSRGEERFQALQAALQRAQSSGREQQDASQETARLRRELEAAQRDEPTQKGNTVERAKGGPWAFLGFT